MNQHLQRILNTIQEDKNLSQEEKTVIIKSLKDANKEFEITSFKLDRTEKVKRTTAILLEETIEELEQKRKAVEAQNRELEIESSLERVRTVAMSMKEAADMLEVCKTISNQLELLNIKEIRNVQTAIFYKEKGTYMNYEYYAKHDKTFITETSYTNSEMHTAFAAQMMKGAGEFFTTNIVGDEVKDWIAYQKTTNVFIDTFLETATSLNYYWYSLGPVALGMSTYVSLREEENNLFKRFLKVFELAYRRYLDIERALSQAKEARIETSLERVRAIAMAMKKSEEVVTVCEVMYKELVALGFSNIRNAQIAVKNNDKQSYLICAYSDKETMILQEAPYQSSPIVKDLYDELEKSKDAFYQREFAGKQFEDWRKWREGLSVLKDNREIAATSLCFYLYSIGNGHLGISTYNPITEEQVAIIKRFKNVFELSYQRYTDVAKAEAQAREAIIEAALEKVRSRSLAMHKSDEIKDVVKKVVEKITELNIEMNGGVSLVTFSPGSKDLLHWLWIPEQLDDVFKAYLPYFNHIIFKDCDDARVQGFELIGKVFSGEDKQTYFNHLFHQTDFSAGPEDVKVWVMQQPYFGFSFAIQKHSGIFLNDYTGKFFSKETNDILIRFSKVFEQAYTRFLDLQKAEAQSRESQIQLALERARTQSMIMQHSKELDDTLRVFHEQVLLLNINSAFSFLWLPDEEKDKHIFWAAWAENNSTVFNSKAINYPLDRNEPATAQCLIDWNSNQPVVSYHVRPAGVENYFFAWKELIAGVEELKPAIFSDGLYYVEAFMKYGCFGVMVKSELEEDEKKILARFAIEFERTYTRFLDLQKAEAQAREAEIELALERIRARTMAMQHSDELADASFLLDSQVRALGLKTWGCAFNIYGENEATEWFSSEAGTMPTYKTPRENIFLRYYQAGQKGEAIYVEEFAGAACDAHYDYLCTVPIMGDALKKVTESGGSLPTRQIDHVTYFKYGYLLFITFEPVPDAHDIFKRFAKVFEQTYTRFLDLQKAEAQAREAQIETGLERVRSRSLAMHNTSELQEVIHTVHKELLHLNIAINGGSFIAINSDIETTLRCWGSGGTADTSEEVQLPLYEKPFCSNLISGIQKGPGFFTEEYTQQEKKDFFTFLFQYEPWSKLNAEQKEETLSSRGGYTRSCCVSQHTSIFIINHFGEKFSIAENDILKRFGKVFEQTYTRFLDLQKAEGQARESQIQLALERVRARTMAMQHSNELSETASEMFRQTELLGLQTWSCGFNIIDRENRQVRQWVSTGDGRVLPAFVTPSDEDVFERFCQAAQKDKSLYVEEMGGETLKAHYQYMASLPEVKKLLDQFQSVEIAPPDFQIFHLASFSYGYLMFITFQPAPEFYGVFKRFAIVFDQTYRRFLDLQKAEAQAKEAKIEVALERVRSSAMSMHTSEGLLTVTHVLREQMAVLEQQELESILIHIYNEAEDTFEAWFSYRHPEDPNGEIIDGKATVSWSKTARAYKDKEKYHSTETDYTIVADYSMLKEWYEYLQVIAPSVVEHDDQGKILVPDVLYYNYSRFSGGALLLITNNAASNDSKYLLKRSAEVFNLAYTRFLDLQKAEAQAREAKIEAAMEKVRSRALAMQKPAELVEVAQLLRKEMNLLGVEELETSSIYIHHEETGKTECWYAIKDVQDPGKELVSDHMNIDLNETEVGKQMLAFYYSDKKKVSIQMQGAGRKEWINYCADHSKVLIGFYGDNIPDRTYHLYKFSNGYMGAASAGDISTESWDLLQRATSVFSLAYTRFSDLQQAEAQARESKIEAALERVRSRTLAMQKSDELAETAAVLFKQLILLGIEPNRLYINIVKDETGDAEFWITDEDGSKVSMAYEDNLNNNRSFKKMFDGWKHKKKSLIIDMKGKVLADYFNYLSSIHVPFKGGLAQKRRLQYIAYFNKGFIGMASPDEQPEETMLLLERFAAVFNLTFTRFNDLKIAEAHAVQAEEDLIKLQIEKARAEDALTELKETQKQLIQSEKMASLGELTAGIAHEIQNPLNFVNNFSEVSKELLDEMKTALQNGDDDDANEIANDVIRNLEKINHHGKRADAIVKGMLQHSRSSTSSKEPTNINTLCDEYIRLCYHGLRAKDNSFNATIQTDFDNSIERINIIPQDISRVVLNVLTNAFYAVNERAKSSVKNYQPLVQIQTKKLNDKVEIKIEDNGYGIPRDIVDKIFQPFFTTKPTGQGTGLGLSLSYDIIKAHGGEIKVGSREGEGSEFMIQLPSA